MDAEPGQYTITGASATLHLKHSFSTQHLRAAKHFATQAARIETRCVGLDRPAPVSHRAYITGAVISAVAGLESSINELYLEAVDRNVKALKGLTEAQVLALSGHWRKNNRDANTLGKYQRALRMCKVAQFRPKAQPFTDALDLVKLRNALIHYAPEWDDETKEHAHLKTRLNNKFPLNRLTKQASLWFPHRCLGSGCARWAWETAFALLNEFCSRLGLPSRT